MAKYVKKENAIVGYKIFNLSKGKISCRSKEFQIGKNSVINGQYVELCQHGLHYCENPLDCLRYYKYMAGKVIYKVKGYGYVAGTKQDHKNAAQHLEILEKVTLKEAIFDYWKSIKFNFKYSENTNTITLKRVKIKDYDIEIPLKTGLYLNNTLSIKGNGNFYNISFKLPFSKSEIIDNNSVSLAIKNSIKITRC